MSRSWSNILAKALLRRKAINFESKGESLARVLTTLDLTALGIGCTIGSGIYVVTGQVAMKAGPSVVLSFVVAGFASILAGLCYAEFGALVPRAGSAYIYSYVTVGELWAFVIGWNLVLEYVIGTAAVARATSAYIDSLSGSVISHWCNEHIPMHVEIFSSFPDLLALAITLVLTVVLCFGVKESSFMNNIFTLVNIAIIIFVIICGSFKANTEYWRLPASADKNNMGKNTTSPDYDHGGFFPYEYSGMLAGAATCFYAFVGFDVIATTGEEVINPSKAIPLSIILSLAICGAGYIGTATILTLLVPYNLLDESAPLSLAFRAVGWDVAYYIISVGAICSLVTCLLTTMFPMPRIIYAMSRDGLLFKFLAKISRRFKLPIIATLLSGLVAGVMAMMFDVAQLVDMMSIGTLLAYTLVSACVLILRYETYDGDFIEMSINETNPPKMPTASTARIVKISVFVIGLLTIWLSLALDFSDITAWWGILLSVIPVVGMIALVILIVKQPRNSRVLSFQVPFVPVLPTLSIVINVYLMLKLSRPTWIRFGGWLVIGAIIYFGYGIRHGGEQTEVEEDEVCNEYESSIKVDAPVAISSSYDNSRSLSRQSSIQRRDASESTHLLA
jgi:amino acid transporter